MLRGTGTYVVGGISYAGTPVMLRGRFVAGGIRATLTAPRCLDAGPFRIFVRRVRQTGSGTGVSAGGIEPSVRIRGIHSSHDGKYQFHSPSSFIVAGSSTA